MLTKIINRFTGSVIFECECDLEAEPLRLGFAVKAAIKAKANLRSADLRSANLRSANLRSADLRSANLRSADLSYADLRSADLRSADLSYADLRSANLRSADLRSANLRSADLSYADLSYADLRSANLRSADLSYADLRSADLSYADLRSADLSYARGLTDETPLPEGVTLGEFKTEIVPQLLAAGGKTVAEVVASGAWDCHDWSNCPMHVAFGIDTPSKAPAIWRPWVERFVHLFDAGLIPCPAIEEAAKSQ